MTVRCIQATTAPNECQNASVTDHNKASSAVASDNSECILYDRWNCGTNGATLELFPAPPTNFAQHDFDNKMGSYRCNLIAPVVKCNILVAGLNDGIPYGYIDTVLRNGVYTPSRSTQTGALAVSFPRKC
ncbi:hypothetical protein DFH09DRAFT_1312511 [Mycena vulgaris]|nr:hypothetical protein DFH09DRAFT_1312511 [Mycena vulgaris]